MTAPRLRTLAARLLAPLLLGLLFALGVGASGAVADDTYGEDEVTITVTIAELTLCDRGLSGCQPDDGALGVTGLQIATPLGLGVLFVAVGLGTYALARRRVATQPD